MREDVHREVARVHRRFADLLDLILRLGKIRGGDDRPDARHLERLVDVDRLDVRVSMRAAQHLAEQHARKGVIGAVLCASGNFVDAVVTNRPRTDDFVMSVL
jgi:hypothetical protein